jgi:two-component system response regulator QseB
VRALLRRTDGRSTLRVGGLCLDRLTRTVSGGTVGGDGVELSEREAALLGVLMSAPRQIFTRGQLLDAVFDGVDSSGAVDTYVHYLRRKLGRGIIHTVHGTGYRFGAE